MLISLLLFCTPAPDDGTTDDSEAADSGEADADTDADTDSDTDADCGVEDLIWGAKILDSSGVCSNCSGPVTIFGTVGSECNGTIEFTTANDCLVRETVVEVHQGSEVHRSNPSCSGGETLWRVSPGEAKQGVAVEDLSLSAGTYNLTLTFNDTRPEKAGKIFDVQ